MDSAYLLIIDESPDLAQVTNSFLRNAGMAIRVVSAGNINELEDVLQEKSPFLVLIGTQLPTSIKIGQVLQITDRFSTPVVLQVETAHTAEIKAGLATHPLQLIQAGENDQLMKVVKQHMSGGKTAREYQDLAQKLEELQYRYDL